MEAFSKAEFPFLTDRLLSPGAASGRWGEFIHREGGSNFTDASVRGGCHTDAYALGQVGSLHSFLFIHSCLPSLPI